MDAPNSLISELEAAVQSGSRDKRIETLRRVTDLFLSGADRFNDQQIGLFDDVLLHLIARVQNKALAELSTRLAPIVSAPAGVIQSLARHDDIAVAAPVLTQSDRLSDLDLIDIAQTKSQLHLWAISGRARLVEPVTDVLVERGDQRVVHALTGNPGAVFSETGYSTLVARAETDQSLAERIGLRLDIPPRLLRELLLKATGAVRTRLLEVVPIETREEIRRVVASISTEIMREATVPRNFAQAQGLVRRMQRDGDFNEAAVMEFARMQKYEEMVASLCQLCATPLDLIERLMQNVSHDGLLVACKAAGLHWPTASAIIANRFADHPFATQDMQRARTDFIKLTQATAKRVLRFWQVRDTIGGAADEKDPEAENLLVDMLRALRIDPALLDRLELSAVQDLQRLCSHCERKGECRELLACGGAADRYHDFCPNAHTLDRLKLQ